jgi:uncharacterized protein (DUF58 family)
MTVTTDIVRQVRRVQLSARRAVRSLAAGEYDTAFKGAGLAFEDVREYQPGDDVRHIDWNASARSGRTLLKRFTEERELTVIVAVDLSASMVFGSTGRTKKSVAADLAAVIALSALDNRDRVGFIGFTDHIERHIRPGRAASRVGRILREILVANPVSKRTDLAAVLRELARVQRRRAVIVVLSDFQSGEHGGAFRRAARQHEVIAVRIHDPVEVQWPAMGMVQVADAETGVPLLIDTSSAAFRNAQRTQFEMRHALFHAQARRAGAEALEVSTAGGHLDTLVQWFHRRARA